MNHENDLDETLQSMRDSAVPDEFFINTTRNTQRNVHNYLLKHKENPAKPYQQTKEEELAHRRSEETFRD